MRCFSDMFPRENMVWRGDHVWTRESWVVVQKKLSKGPRRGVRFVGLRRRFSEMVVVVVVAVAVVVVRGIGALIARWVALGDIEVVRRV